MESAMTSTQDKTEAAKKLTLLVYILQAAGVFVGVTAIAGVIINHVKKDDTAGTWLESHFRWQMRTFWFALLWYILGGITTIFGIGIFIMIGTSIWIIYRVVKGWLSFNENRKMYTK